MSFVCPSCERKFPGWPPCLLHLKTTPACAARFRVPLTSQVVMSACYGGSPKGGNTMSTPMGATAREATRIGATPMSSIESSQDSQYSTQMQMSQGQMQHSGMQLSQGSQMRLSQGELSQGQMPLSQGMQLIGQRLSQEVQLSETMRPSQGFQQQPPLLSQQPSSEMLSQQQQMASQQQSQQPAQVLSQPQYSIQPTPGPSTQQGFFSQPIQGTRSSPTYPVSHGSPTTHVSSLLAKSNQPKQRPGIPMFVEQEQVRIASPKQHLRDIQSAVGSLKKAAGVAALGIAEKLKKKASGSSTESPTARKNAGETSSSVNISGTMVPEFGLIGSLNLPKASMNAQSVSSSHRGSHQVSASSPQRARTDSNSQGTTSVGATTTEDGSPSKQNTAAATSISISVTTNLPIADSTSLPVGSNHLAQSNRLPQNSGIAQSSSVAQNTNPNAVQRDLLSASHMSVEMEKGSPVSDRMLTPFSDKNLTPFSNVKDTPCSSDSKAPVSSSSGFQSSDSSEDCDRIMSSCDALLMEVEEIRPKSTLCTRTHSSSPTKRRDNKLFGNSMNIVMSPHGNQLPVFGGLCSPQLSVAISTIDELSSDPYCQTTENRRGCGGRSGSTKGIPENRVGRLDQPSPKPWTEGRKKKGASKTLLKEIASSFTANDGSTGGSPDSSPVSRNQSLLVQVNGNSRLRVPFQLSSEGKLGVELMNESPYGFLVSCNAEKFSENNDERMDDYEDSRMETDDSDDDMPNLQRSFKKIDGLTVHHSSGHSEGLLKETLGSQQVLLLGKKTVSRGEKIDSSLLSGQSKMVSESEKPSESNKPSASKKALESKKRAASGGVVETDIDDRFYKLKMGDRILGVNGRNFEGMGIDEIEDALGDEIKKAMEDAACDESTVKSRILYLDLALTREVMYVHVDSNSPQKSSNGIMKTGTSKKVMSTSTMMMATSSISSISMCQQEISDRPLRALPEENPDGLICIRDDYIENVEMGDVIRKFRDNTKSIGGLSSSPNEIHLFNRKDLVSADLEALFEIYAHPQKCTLTLDPVETLRFKSSSLVVEEMKDLKILQEDWLGYASFENAESALIIRARRSFLHEVAWEIANVLHFYEKVPREEIFARAEIVSSNTSGLENQGNGIHLIPHQVFTGVKGECPKDFEDILGDHDVMIDPFVNTEITRGCGRRDRRGASGDRRRRGSHCKSSSSRVGMGGKSSSPGGLVESGLLDTTSYSSGNRDTPLRLLVLMGFPGSGKSTLAMQLDKELAKNSGVSCYRISQDELGLKKKCFERFGKIVNKVIQRLERKSPKQTLIIIDRCNISREQRRMWLDAIDTATKDCLKKASSDNAHYKKMCRDLLHSSIPIDCVYLDVVSPQECSFRIVERDHHETIQTKDLHEAQSIVNKFVSCLEFPQVLEGFESVHHCTSEKDLQDFIVGYPKSNFLEPCTLNSSTLVDVDHQVIHGVEKGNDKIEQIQQPQQQPSYFPNLRASSQQEPSLFGQPQQPSYPSLAPNRPKIENFEKESYVNSVAASVVSRSEPRKSLKKDVLNEFSSSHKRKCTSPGKKAANSMKKKQRTIDNEMEELLDHMMSDAIGRDSGFSAASSNDSPFAGPARLHTPTQESEQYPHGGVSQEDSLFGDSGLFGSPSRFGSPSIFGNSSNSLFVGGDPFDGKESDLVFTADLMSDIFLGMDQARGNSSDGNTSSRGNSSKKGSNSTKNNRKGRESRKNDVIDFEMIIQEESDNKGNFSLFEKTTSITTKSKNNIFQLNSFQSSTSYFSPVKSSGRDLLNSSSRKKHGTNSSIETCLTPGAVSSNNIGDGQNKTVSSGKKKKKRNKKTSSQQSPWETAQQSPFSNQSPILQCPASSQNSRNDSPASSQNSRNDSSQSSQFGGSQVLGASQLAAKQAAASSPPSSQMSELSQRLAQPFTCTTCGFSSTSWTEMLDHLKELDHMQELRSTKKGLRTAIAACMEAAENRK